MSSVATGLNRQAVMRRVALTHVAVTQAAGSWYWHRVSYEHHRWHQSVRSTPRNASAEQLHEQHLLGATRGSRKRNMPDTCPGCACDV